MNRTVPNSTPRHLDRRARGPLNRARRFLNDFWLVPVVVLYFQLLAAMVGAQAGDNHPLSDINRRILAGVPALGHIVTDDFPYTLIGHSKEVLHILGGLEQRISPDDLAARLIGNQSELYRTLWTSRSEKTTEWGGIVTLNEQHTPELHLIPSSNGRFIGQLERLPWQQGMDWISAAENAELVNILAMSGINLTQVADLLARDDVDEPTKVKLYRSISHTLRTISEARYLLQPDHFKSYLGHSDTWRYVGMFHFHNRLEAPPSEADVEASYRVRQLIFALARDGFDLYDISNGVTTATHFTVTDDAWVTQPEWFSLSDPGATI